MGSKAIFAFAPVTLLRDRFSHMTSLHLPRPRVKN